MSAIQSGDTFTRTIHHSTDLHEVEQFLADARELDFDGAARFEWMDDGYGELSMSVMER